MSRLLFEKTKSAIYISHLDLMRVFQRAFRRAGYLLHHTEGFNQRAYVSLALPLSVGTASVCEILEFVLDDPFSPQELRERLNRTLPEGILVREVYESSLKFKFLRYLQADVFLEYDGGVPAQAAEKIGALLQRPALPMTKHGKKGDTEVDLAPMLDSACVLQQDAQTLQLQVLVSAQNPSLNPMQLAQAIAQYLPDCKPDFASCRRQEVLTAEKTPFR